MMSFCAGLADANSSGHDTFASGYEALLARVLSVPASQAELQSLQTGTAPASVPARRRLLTSQVHLLRPYLQPLLSPSKRLSVSISLTVFASKCCMHTSLLCCSTSIT